MKAVKFSLLLFIFFLPVVSAQVSLDPFTSDTYNYGSKILMSGNVAQSHYVRAKLDFNLLCSQGSTRLASLLINLRTNEPARFSQLVSIPKTVLGSCNIKVDVLDQNGNILETKDFSAFQVTNDLKANFQSVSGGYQLGDSFYLRGTVSRIDNVLVDGVASLKFRQGENIVFIDSSELVNGVLDYSKTLTLLPSGPYVVDVDVSDNFGNTHGF